MCGARCASAALLHVNLLLAVYAGAALCTAARLKWDPSTYVVLRELLPREYAAAAAALPAAALALLLTAQLALAALSARAALRRRVLLLLYAGCMVTLVVLEVSVAAWLSARAAAWLRSEQAARLAEALELRDHLRPLLHYLGRWHPLPDKLRAVIDEAEADLPRNGYVAATAATLLLALQLAAVALALVAARAPRSARLSRAGSGSSSSGGGGERAAGRGAAADEDTAPLKAKYRGGRLVLV